MLNDQKEIPTKHFLGVSLYVNFPKSLWSVEVTDCKQGNVYKRSYNLLDFHKLLLSTATYEGVRSVNVPQSTFTTHSLASSSHASHAFEVELELVIVYCRKITVLSRWPKQTYISFAIQFYFYTSFHGFIEQTFLSKKSKDRITTARCREKLILFFVLWEGQCSYQKINKMFSTDLLWMNLPRKFYVFIIRLFLIAYFVGKRKWSLNYL